MVTELVLADYSTTAVVQWTQSASSLSTSASPTDTSKHCKSQYGDTVFTARDSTESFTVKLGECGLWCCALTVLLLVCDVAESELSHTHFSHVWSRGAVLE